LATSLILSLRAGVAVRTDEQGRLAVEDAESRVTLRRPATPVAAALTRLANEGADDELLADTAFGEGDAPALAEWYYALQALDRHGWVVRTLVTAGAPLVTLLPYGALSPPPRALPGDQPFVLSRFAYLRRDGDRLQLESPTAGGRVIVHDPRVAAVIAALAAPATAARLASAPGEIDVEALGRLFGLLATARLIVPAPAGRPNAEDASPALGCWEFHDLLFHARSRRGRHDAPVGATFRMAGASELPPALRSDTEPESVALDRPDLRRVVERDPPLTQVIESRRSIRRYGDSPVNVTQLGEFLFRVARVKELRRSEVETPAGTLSMEFAPRPYPSGGALYELEFYVAVRSCEGLAPGLYRYQAGKHALGVAAYAAAELDRLFRDAAASAGIAATDVQVLLVLAARVPRVAWKYASIAYALVLKHVGVVYQTMYLTATAMGLAPCALGAGDSDLFARTSGSDYYAETSVGEFLLGSRGEPTHDGPNAEAPQRAGR
jgi:SagB-type dehydrogenase family enzyme